MIKGLRKHRLRRGWLQRPGLHHHGLRQRPEPDPSVPRLPERQRCRNHLQRQLQRPAGEGTKKWSGKSYIDANYTWSRALTNAINDYSTAPQNVYNINGDYGRAVYDRTTIITLDGVYELPWYRDQHGIAGHIIGGWEVSGLYVIDSGLPLTVTESSSGGTLCYSCSATGGGAVQTSILGLANNPTNIVNDNVGLGILGASGASLRPNQILRSAKRTRRPAASKKSTARQNWF